jgi:hypothetical protein
MKPDEIRIASAYFFQDKALIHALGRTTRGAWIPVGAIRVVPRESWTEVEAALRQALDHSRTHLPHPEDWAAVMEPLLTASGARKWPDFLKEALCLGLEQRGEALSLVPTRNLGEAGGFEPLPTEAVRLGSGSSGEALREALGRCR